MADVWLAATLGSLVCGIQTGALNIDPNFESEKQCLARAPFYKGPPPNCHTITHTHSGTLVTSQLAKKISMRHGKTIFHARKHSPRVNFMQFYFLNTSTSLFGNFYGFLGPQSGQISENSNFTFETLCVAATDGRLFDELRTRANCVLVTGSDKSAELSCVMFQLRRVKLAEDGLVSRSDRNCRKWN